MFKIQEQIKNCDDFFSVVNEFMADGCSNDRAFDLACQLLEIEKTTGSFMTGLLKLIYLNGSEQCFNVVLPLNDNEYRITKSIQNFLSIEIKASHQLNKHSTAKNLENLIPSLKEIIFKYVDGNGNNNEININPKLLLA